MIMDSYCLIGPALLSPAPLDIIITRLSWEATCMDAQTDTHTQLNEDTHIKYIQEHIEALDIQQLNKKVCK